MGLVVPGDAGELAIGSGGTAREGRRVAGRRGRLTGQIVFLVQVEVHVVLHGVRVVPFHVLLDLLAAHVIRCL